VGCRGDNYFHRALRQGRRSNDGILSYALVGSMGRYLFTVTKDDTTTVATAGLRRMGILRCVQVQHAINAARHGSTRTIRGCLDSAINTRGKVRIAALTLAVRSFDRSR